MTDTPDKTGERVDRRLQVLRERLEPRVRSALDGVLDGLGVDPRGSVAALLSPAFLPAGSLPIHVASALARRGQAPSESAIDDAVDAALAGYLFAVVIGFLSDEPPEDPAGKLLAAAALSQRHAALLGRVVGDHPSFWDLHESTWTAAFEANLLERRILRKDATYGDEELSRVAERFLPIVLPAAALLSAAGAFEQVAPLVDAMHHAATAARLADDLADALRDRRASRYSWVVRRHGGEVSDKELFRQLWFQGGVSKVLDRILEEVEAAADGLRALDLPDTATVIALDAARTTERYRDNVDGLRETVIGGGKQGGAPER